MEIRVTLIFNHKPAKDASTDFRCSRWLRKTLFNQSYLSYMM